jgi:ElaB/YqjD/DUF883 family membrane-anchored ribosome-binding protein
VAYFGYLIRMIMENNQTSVSGESASKLGSTVSSIETKAHSAIDRAASQSHGGVDTAAQGAHDAVSKTASKAQEAGATLRDAKDAALDKSADVMATLSAPVKQNPLTAVAGAFAIGYLFARLTR